MKESPKKKKKKGTLAEITERTKLNMKVIFAYCKILTK